MMRRSELLAGALLLAGAARAFAVEEPPTIRSGAIELGVAGSLVSVEGAANGELRVRSGAFAALGGVLAGAEADVGYDHVQELDRLDALASLTASLRAGSSSLHPYIGATGGVRQEWMGSFRQSRFPVGVCAGVRVLAAERVGFRVDYRWLRVLDDPVADFTEHGLVVGVSLYFRNDARTTE
jgi:hypothetical protein